MSSQGDFFDKFISARNYKIQRGIYKVMTELDAYDTPIRQGKNTSSNYIYLRNVHMEFFRKYLPFVNQWDASSDFDGDIASLRCIVEDILAHKKVLRGQVEEELNEFDEMLPVDEEIAALEEKLAELKDLRREMYNNPPPPPQPLPRYIDDPKNKFRMMKDKMSRQMPILLKKFTQFKIKSPEDEAVELINGTLGVDNSLQFNNSVLMIMEPENEELCYEKLREAKKGFKKDKFDVQLDEPVSNYYINNLHSLDHIVVLVRGSPVSNDTVEHSYRILLPQPT
jgi:hypothetical protein